MSKGSSTKKALAEERLRWDERHAYELRFLQSLSISQCADVINAELAEQSKPPITEMTVWRRADRYRKRIHALEDHDIDAKRQTRVALLDQITAAALKLAVAEGTTPAEKIAALAQATRSQQAAILVEGSAAPVKTEAKVEVTMVDAKDLELARMLDVAPSHDVMVVPEATE